MSLPARIALVTGAAQGIGRAIARRLAEDGCAVAVNDMASNYDKLRELAAEIEGKGRRAHVATADVTLEHEVKGMVEGAVEALGGLDVMVANAGILTIGSLADQTVAEWDHVFAVNVRGAMLCYQAAAAAMIRQGRGGRIIGACSMAGKKAMAFHGAYSASKFAVRGLTQSTAAELGKYGITINAYAPGFVGTAMMEDALPHVAAVQGTDVDAIRKSTAGCVGQPRDVASLVSFLASQESRFITGETILCDGGMLIA